MGAPTNSNYVNKVANETLMSNVHPYYFHYMSCTNFYKENYGFRRLVVVNKKIPNILTNVAKFKNWTQ
uniref:Uncharacterized protein n=1 Tax=Lepeophtheirus salmonis TaxID=72036 RepID=A0A0K2V779_LEPSM